MNESPSALQKERALSDELAGANLSPDAYSRWNACRSSLRFMAFIDKELIAYRLLFGKPNVLNTYRCLSVSLTGDTGLSSVWGDGKQKYVVGYTPLEIAEGCFLLHLRSSGVDFDQYRGRFNTRFSMRYKTMLNPETRQEGSVFLLEKTVFNSHFGN